MSLDTVKGWESGRRPLANARTTDVHNLRFALGCAGAPHEQLVVLDEAVRADFTLERITSRQGPHPLGGEVVTRPFATLLAWPLTGQAPPSLANGYERPVLGTGQREQVYSALREAADQSPNVLLRRQVYYLLAPDPGSQTWLADAVKVEKRRMPRLDRWTPQWAMLRSLAISRSMSGDREPLREFLERGCSDDATLVANLRYWAYWAGLTGTVQRSDEFMAADDLGQADWGALLTGLTRRLSVDVGYVELCVRAVWALVERMPALLDDGSLSGPLVERVAVLLDAPDGLAQRSRHELDEIRAAVDWRARR